MSSGPGPSVRRRQLGAMLRQLRLDAGKTRKDAAHWLEIGEPTVSKIELGKQTIKGPNVRLLCQLYDADAGTVDTLLRLVREANQRGWWSQYRETVPDWFKHFVGLEGDAKTLWEYASEYVPGLLQTPAYIEAITRAFDPNFTDEQVTQRVELRKRRQAEIDTDRAPQMNIYLNESVIRRLVGGPDVMREQLNSLIEMAKRDKISIRIVPFSAGAHPAMTSSFVMAKFPDEHAAAFAYVENRRGAVYQEDPGDLESYTLCVDGLAEVALDEDASRVMLTNAAGSL